MSRSKIRPQVVKSVTVRQETGHGTLFATVSYLRRKHPLEVFLTIGKAGGCDPAWLETVGRLLSTALRHGVPPQELIHQLRGIRCDTPLAYSGNTEKVVHSPVDALSHILEAFCDGTLSRPQADPGALARGDAAGNRSGGAAQSPREAT